MGDLATGLRTPVIGISRVTATGQPLYQFGSAVIAVIRRFTERSLI